MAHQNEYMFSGLEREIELYMGEEHEAPKDSNGKSHTISVIDTAGAPMSFTFSVDQNKQGYVYTSEHTYKKRTGLTTKTFRVPGVTQPIVALNKKGNTAFIVSRDFLQFNEDYDASKPETVNNMRFNVVKQNALTQFEILESKSVLKLSVSVNGKWVSTEYPIQEPVAQKIEEFKKFISGLQIDVLREKYFDEYELTPDGNSYWIRARGSEGGTSDIKLTIDSGGKSGNIYMNILTPDAKKKEGAVNENVVNIVSHTGKDITGEVKRWPLKVADVRMEILTSGTPTIRLKVTLNKEPLAKKVIDAIAAVLKIEAKDIDETYEIIRRNSLTPAQEAQGLIDFIKTKLGTSELEFIDEEYDYKDEYDELEYELDDDEFAYEYEYEGDDEPDEEFEFEQELNALEDDGVTENFARRLYELSTRSYESEYELDEELDRALDAVEDEFMVKRLHRKKKRGKRKGLFKKILSTGAKIVGKIASKTPIGSLIKAGTSLVRGNVKGALGNLAKAAVGAVLPPGVGTVATAAMDALGGGEEGGEGGEGGEEGEIRRGGRRKRAIRRVARIARDTYREVADTLPENFDHPLVANEVARKAVRKAMIKNGVKPPAKADGIPQHKRVIKLRHGEKIVITG